MMFTEAEGEMGKKRNAYRIFSPVRVKERILGLIICVYCLNASFLNLIFYPPTFTIPFHPLCTVSSEWGWQKIPLIFSFLWCLLANACCNVKSSQACTFHGCKECVLEKLQYQKKMKKKERGEKRRGEERVGEEKQGRGLGWRDIFSLNFIEM